MKNMLICGAVLVVVMVSPLYAANGQGPGEGFMPSFDEKKDKTIKTIDERIEILKQRKECTLKAKSFEDIDECKKRFNIEEKMPPIAPGPK